ncbi:putative uncharacterized protein DDB_G0282133 [Condylostylus longicornis]|uniref:putative uncharacterized protein DDB_G0282133 n=1 Tax=Condylostylus longicornis TaxID=2530218 RepID=UPI00244DD6EB|nr:putative uncharacterized protein DDB_G0282133 [Condylostylus longicornis]
MFYVIQVLYLFLLIDTRVFCIKINSTLIVTPKTIKGNSKNLKNYQIYRETKIEDNISVLFKSNKDEIDENNVEKSHQDSINVYHNKFFYRNRRDTKFDWQKDDENLDNNHNVKNRTNEIKNFNNFKKEKNYLNERSNMTEKGNLGIIPNDSDSRKQNIEWVSKNRGASNKNPEVHEEKESDDLSSEQIFSPALITLSAGEYFYDLEKFNSRKMVFTTTTENNNMTRKLSPIEKELMEFLKQHSQQHLEMAKPLLSDVKSILWNGGYDFHQKSEHSKDSIPEKKEKGDNFLKSTMNTSRSFDDNESTTQLNTEHYEHHTTGTYKIGENSEIFASTEFSKLDTTTNIPIIGTEKIENNDEKVKSNSSVEELNIPFSNPTEKISLVSIHINTKPLNTTEREKLQTSDTTINKTIEMDTKYLNSESNKTKFEPNANNMTQTKSTIENLNAAFKHINNITENSTPNGDLSIPKLKNGRVTSTKIQNFKDTNKFQISKILSIDHNKGQNIMTIDENYKNQHNLVNSSNLTVAQRHHLIRRSPAENLTRLHQSRNLNTRVEVDVGKIFVHVNTGIRDKNHTLWNLFNIVKNATQGNGSNGNGNGGGGNNGNCYDGTSNNGGNNGGSSSNSNGNGENGNNENVDQSSRNKGNQNRNRNNKIGIKGNIIYRNENNRYKIKKQVDCDPPNIRNSGCQVRTNNYSWSYEKLNHFTNQNQKKMTTGNKSNTQNQHKIDEINRFSTFSKNTNRRRNKGFLKVLQKKNQKAHNSPKRNNEKNTRQPTRKKVKSRTQSTNGRHTQLMQSRKSYLSFFHPFSS